MKQESSEPSAHKSLLVIIFLFTTAAVIFTGFAVRSNETFDISLEYVVGGVAVSVFLLILHFIFSMKKLTAFLFWVFCFALVIRTKTTVMDDTRLRNNLIIQQVDEGADNLAIATIKDETNVNEDIFQSKIHASMECFSQCQAEDDLTPTMNNFESDSRILRRHYYELLEATKSFRPKKRRKSSIYKGYTGPRLEDHFIHNLISEDFLELFFPIVPLFIHWTEVQFGNAGGGHKALMDFFESNLRKDVVYFTVTSAESYHIQETLREMGLKVIFASSKGDVAAQIILPHLFYYNPPGFDSKGEKIYDNAKFEEIKIDYDYSFDQMEESRINELKQPLTEEEKKKANHAKVITLREKNDLIGASPEWRFRQYSSYFSLSQTDLSDNFNDSLDNKLFPDEARISFIGSTRTHKGRRALITALDNKYEEKDFMHKNFPADLKCTDYSSGSDASFCWRVFMLSSGLTLAPVGTAPVSYRLYEALQMGVPPIYIHDERGAFIPYKGTSADISNFGMVFSFDEAEQRIDDLFQMEGAAFEDMVSGLRKSVGEYRDTHFTPQGVVGQIKKWLQRPFDSEHSDLRCCSNPLTP